MTRALKLICFAGADIVNFNSKKRKVERKQEAEAVDGSEECFPSFEVRQDKKMHYFCKKN
jgi:hypothetical protein